MNASMLVSRIYNDLGQSHLVSTLQQIFPEVHLNARKTGGVKYPPTSQFLELDCWFPDLKLAFEYQDPHHYVTTWYSNVSHQNYLIRDQYKHTEMINKGSTLIVVPCWWDGTKESLIATIKNERSDLLSHVSNHGVPIPNNPPKHFFNKLNIPVFGELMLASFSASSLFDPSSWWVSEKYDGVRACWDPFHNKLYSKSGAEIRVLDFITNDFPSIFVDGELWFGRGNFIETSRLSFLNAETPNLETEQPTWATLRYIVFDNPLKLVDNNENDTQDKILAANMKCKDKRHSNYLLKKVMEGGGEGIILREPKSLYQKGRSPHLIKIKSQRDMEGLVVAIDADSCTLLLPNGMEIQVEETETELEIGMVVTFSYVSFDKKGLPTIPKIIRERRDISWNLLCLDSPDSRSLFLTSVSKKTVANPARRNPSGYWTEEKSENIRKFFENFAISRSFDPLLAHNWYLYSGDDVQSAEHGKTVMGHYNNSFIHAIMDTYPNIGLEEHKFSHMRRNFWSDEENKKMLFDNFAQKRGFDPISEYRKWYNIDSGDIIKELGGKTVLNTFGSLINALKSLYPSVPFKEHLFTRMQKKYWKDKSNRREFFIRFAKRNKFDPLVPHNWYPIHAKEITNVQGGISVVAYHGSFFKALIDLFPDIGLQEDKFLYVNTFTYKYLEQFWRKYGNKKAYFEQ